MGGKNARTLGQGGCGNWDPGRTLDGKYSDHASRQHAPKMLRRIPVEGIREDPVGFESWLAGMQQRAGEDERGNRINTRDGWKCLWWSQQTVILDRCEDLSSGPPGLIITDYLLWVHSNESSGRIKPPNILVSFTS